MGYILALDQGTTSSRAVLVDKKGQIVGVAQRQFKQYFPKSGWVEHDAKEIWSTEAAVIAEVLAKTKVASGDIAGIGITNQRETTVIWDRKTSKPIHPAIVWQDRRTASTCEQMKEHEAMIQQKTGLLLDPYFSATKIRYILDKVPGAKEKAKRGELAFGTIDSWLVWNLTQGEAHITDVTNASRTLLFNIHTMEWDEELLALFDIPPQLLPEVKSCSEVYGHTHTEVFPKPIPICGIAGDQQASMFGHACFEKGAIKTTFGTGAFTMLNTGSEAITSHHRLLTTVGWKIGNDVTYAIEGSVFMAGASIKWLREGIELIDDAKEVDIEAKKVKDCGGVFIVPAFTGLGAPHWDPKARGIILGLSRGTTKGHLCRAMLEGIAYQVADVIDCMNQEIDFTPKIMRVDGGVTLSKFLMQFQSDLLQTTIEKPQSKEMTALGACYLAGLAVGFWKDLDEIGHLWKLKESFSPEKDVSEQRVKWNRAIECAKHWEME